MTRSRKDRRSERIPATHRLLLSILGSSGAEVLKEIVTTVEVSQHGAKISGRRTLQKDWRGLLTQLTSGRQAPFRVVWQVPAPSSGQLQETGVEILADFNFWGRTFSSPDTASVEIAIENEAVPPEELLKSLKKWAAFQSPGNEKLLEAIWCGLVQQLEERKVFTRAELAATLRKLGQM